MTQQVFDVIGALLICVGAFFCLAAAVGIVRFPDVLTRMHAATKPQSFGLLVALVGVMLTVWSWQATALCTLVISLQIVTSATSAHMVGRAAYRTGQWDNHDCRVDELAEDLELAGFRLSPDGAVGADDAQSLDDAHGRGDIKGAV